VDVEVEVEVEGLEIAAREVEAAIEFLEDGLP